MIMSLPPREIRKPIATKKNFQQPVILAQPALE
ncbi:hypothetical protein YPC_2767 [Yersinia pestis biovar Medievalis str. Harbin 35]|nr:hypothetical protein YPC_2767 [Yersinia pestis biovar Medievalis str. Harbin 35]EEO75015.1 hypothetical protein YP516_2900 [Yersinia pestis Nepal516]EEO81886.1 hypothetical protein YPF_1863 [Yersinia pestis biovar Orientalis str. India 195]EEO87786.1 hypothetical protein YPH_3755 [Yersinia pestis biovar Orientalis str. PEXU2]EEO88803.1 hypothetical protein YPS_3652 [Yersinia pestis Pestoides A]